MKHANKNETPKTKTGDKKRRKKKKKPLMEKKKTLHVLYDKF